MLVEFGPDIWIADGPVVTAAAGFHYPTRMTVLRLSNGDLIVWSPVAISDALRAEIGRLGPVGYLVPPSTLHDTFLAEWQRAYPEANVYAPPGLAERRQDIRFDGAFSDGPIAGWAGEVDVVIVPGNRITTEIVGFHRKSGTAIFTDLLQQFPPGWFKGWRGLVARLDLMVGDAPAVPRKFRVAFTDRRAAREALDRILAWPTQEVLMAHGQPVARDGQAVLRRAFGWLTGR